MLKLSKLLEKQSIYSTPDKYSNTRLATHFTFVCATATLFITVFRPFVSYIPIELIVLGLITSGVLYVLWFIFKEGLLIEHSSKILLAVSKLILLPMLIVSGGINSQFLPVVLILPFIFLLIGGFNYAIVSIIFWTIVWPIFFFIGPIPFDLTNSIWDEGKVASITLWLMLTNILSLMIIIKIENINRRQQNALIQLANSDVLTGVLNRRGLIETLEKDIEDSKKHLSQLSVMFIDIDHFKKFNDHNGHAEGDIALRRVAQCLQDNVCPGKDTIARFGGEEFVAILKRVDQQKAHNIADEMRTAVKSLALFYGTTTNDRLSITIGFYTTRCRDEDQKIILKKADNALYYGKANGRDKTVCANTLADV